MGKTQNIDKSFLLDLETDTLYNPKTGERLDAITGLRVDPTQLKKRKPNIGQTTFSQIAKSKNGLSLNDLTILARKGQRTQPIATPDPTFATLKQYLAKDVKQPERMTYSVKRRCVLIGFFHALKDVKEASKLKYKVNGKLPKKTATGLNTLIHTNFLNYLKGDRKDALVLLLPSEVDRLLKNDMQQYLAQLSKPSLFPIFKYYPTDVKTALLIMAFRLGNPSDIIQKLPKFTWNVRYEFWERAAKESGLSGVSALNAVVKKLFMNAYAAQKKHMQNMSKSAPKRVVASHSSDNKVVSDVLQKELLSGAHWANKYVEPKEESKKIEQLAPEFRNKVKAFLKVLRDNGAIIEVTSTRRPKERAFLFHWSWKIAKRKVKYSDLNTIRDIYHTNIIWDHGDEDTSVQKAIDIANKYGILGETVTPSLTSNHINGLAIDMKIKYLPPILNYQDKENQNITLEVESSKNWKTNAINDKLIALAKEFGIIKFQPIGKDKPHWSNDGK